MHTFLSHFVHKREPEKNAYFKQWPEMRRFPIISDLFEESFHLTLLSLLYKYIAHLLCSVVHRNMYLKKIKITLKVL